jgi:hypothetical protein
MRQLCPEPVVVSKPPVSPGPGSASQVWPPWLGLSGRLILNHRPHGRETVESGTGGWAGNPRQCYQWQHPQLDQLAEYQDLQARPQQDPQRSRPAQLLSLEPLASDAILA